MSITGCVPSRLMNSRSYGQSVNNSTLNARCVPSKWRLAQIWKHALAMPGMPYFLMMYSPVILQMIKQKQYSSTCFAVPALRGSQACDVPTGHFSASGVAKPTRCVPNLASLLVDIAKRDMVEVLARQATVLREDDDVLEELASMLDPTDARALCKAPRALARRSIRRWLSNPKPPDLATVERVLAVACGDAGACDIGQGRSVRRSHQRLEIHLGHMR
jgi:hypothetical protein